MKFDTPTTLCGFRVELPCQKSHTAEWTHCTRYPRVFDGETVVTFTYYVRKLREPDL